MATGWEEVVGAETTEGVFAIGPTGELFVFAMVVLVAAAIFCRFTPYGVTNRVLFGTNRVPKFNRPVNIGDIGDNFLVENSLQRIHLTPAGGS